MIDNADTIKKLREISTMFDIRCEITVDEDSIDIKGLDYLPTYVEGQEHLNISRVYEVPYIYNDETGELEDTLTPVLEKIKQDGEKLSNMVSQS